MIPFRNFERVHNAGDSFVVQQWYLGLIALMNAAFPGTVVRGGVVTGRAAQQGTSPARLGGQVVESIGAMSVTSSGINGNPLSDLAANVSTRILPFNPDIVWVNALINEALAGTGAVSIQASTNTIISAVQAQNPNARLLFNSCFMGGEQYQAGPDWASTSLNANILVVDNACAAACAGKPGVEYVDHRVVALAYEVAHNLPGPPGVNSGILTGDTIHPNDVVGKPLMCSTAFSHLQAV